jgi:predicted RNA-binding Zn-ribbon protein involved in translation (DUF1610 family)
MGIFGQRTDGYVCSDCGHQWRVPKRVRRRARKWRTGGYGYVDAHAAGIRAVSTSYQGYMSDIKNQRNTARDADLTLAAAATTCPNCGSVRHTPARR